MRTFELHPTAAAPALTCSSWSWAAFSADECRWLDASYGHR